MNTKLLLSASAVVVIAIFVALRGFKGQHEGLKRVEVLPLVDATGPESLVFDADGGGPYTGVSDGRILKWESEKGRWIDFAAPLGHWSSKEECRGSQDQQEVEHVCGRPLGLQFNEKTGELYIADAYVGLLMVPPNGTAAPPVVTEAEGLPFHFTNGLDINQDSGVVYFTDSSTRFRRRDFMSAIIAGDKTGRLIKYDPHSKVTQVLLNNLSFPNGVAVSTDGSFLLIAETTTCRILRYWLRTPEDFNFEVLTELSGFPDNIKKSPRGGFWVAMHSKRGRLQRWALSIPWMRELLLWIPNDVHRITSLMSRWRGAMAVRLSEEGEVLEVLEGFGGRRMRLISEVYEHNGSLWFGSVVMPFVGIYKLQSI